MVTALPMGDRAILLEVGTLDDVLALHAALAASRPDGVVDIVPAARTVLVRIDPRRIALAAARTWALAAAADDAPIEQDAREVELDVVYDGEDLADTAALLGVGPDELVRRHASARWSVAFTGFAPGFGYLVSDDWPFDVPRLDVPRTRVPAGSVALAAGFSGAYPRETPGGWRLIGTTSAILFDPDAASPALLAPGTIVRFRAAREHLVAVRPQVAEPASAARDTTRGVLRILEPGLLATVQDDGRAGAASLGVAGSGALDRGALRTANRLVGNPEDAAAVEITMGGLRATATADVWFAVTGAWGRITLDGRELDPYEAHSWPSGAELHLDWFAHGARAYLAVRGGIDTPVMLGSRSTDVMSGIGPAPLAPGAVLALGPLPDTPIPVGELQPWGAPRDEELEIALGPGPRADWFAASAHSALFDAVWTVSQAADRVGIRLEGPALERTRSEELPSEGMVPGALQVPPNGRPVVL
ncbi:MAG: carboxyltransferase domain-containing protein, partial [Microbacterium sp.]